MGPAEMPTLWPAGLVSEFRISWLEHVGRGAALQSVSQGQMVRKSPPNGEAGREKVREKEQKKRNIRDANGESGHGLLHLSKAAVCGWIPGKAKTRPLRKPKTRSDCRKEQIGNSVLLPREA